MAETLRLALFAMLMAGGLIFEISAVFGANRFRFSLNRMHPAGMGDTLGLLLMALAMIVYTGFDWIALKILYTPGRQACARNGRRAAENGGKGMEILNVILLAVIVACAVAVSLTRDLLSAVIVFMIQGLAMSVVWILLQAPDLAITEAAVGTGISTVLMLAALKKIQSVQRKEERRDAGKQKEA